MEISFWLHRHLENKGKYNLLYLLIVKKYFKTERIDFKIMFTGKNYVYRELEKCQTIYILKILFVSKPAIMNSYDLTTTKMS